MAIKIPVEGSFNQGDIKTQIALINDQVKTLGKAVAEANKQKFEPISLRSKEDLAAFVRQTQQLLNLQTELKKRMQETGQANKMPLSANWTKLYPNEAERNRKLQEVLGFYGADFEDLPPPPGKPPRTPHKPRFHVPGYSPGTGGGWRQTGADVVGAGLNATGAVGNVASRALGTGMSSGFGAGLMGLAGGILALGVGKAIGSVVNRLGGAEDNEIAYDTLKRTLGDVNVAFNSLKTVVKDTGNQYKVTFAESARLSTLYARQGNLRGSDYLTMGGEVGAGIGLSRSFGLAPEAGVSALSGFRGLNVAHNESQVRHFAVLIGETITKSGAFAKADEVMSAISNYTAMQTRQTLTQNVKGYATQLSALTATRLPGMDVQGAANVLAQADSAIKNGGGAGEASQFLLYSIGADHGLNPFQLQQFQEGGASATLSSTLGKGSMADKFGMPTVEGDKTLLAMALQRIRAQYARYEKEKPGIVAAMTARFFHTTMGRAEALQQLQLNDGLGTLQSQLKEAGIDLKDIDASAMSAMGQVVGGSKDDRLKIAKELFERRDRDTGKLVLSDKERGWLNTAMKGGDDERQTSVLLKLLATHGQQETMGKDIRDSRKSLDNIATNLAEKLIPFAQTSRDALLALVGPDTGPRATQAKLAKARIDEQYQPAIDAAKAEYDTYNTLSTWAADPNDEINQKNRQKASAAWDKWHSLEQARDKAVDDRRKLIYQNLVKPGAEQKPMLFGAEKDWQPTGSGAGKQRPYVPGIGLPPSYELGPNDLTGPSMLLKAMVAQESGGRHRNADGSLLTSSAGAQGIAQIMPKTGADPGYGVAPLRNHSRSEMLRFMRDYITAMLRKYGTLRKALAAYNAGPGTLEERMAMASRDGRPEDWLSYMPKETRDYVPKVMQRMRDYERQIPNTPQGNGGGDMRLTADPIRVDVNVNGPGTATAPPHLQARINRASATGAH